VAVHDEPRDGKLVDARRSHWRRSGAAHIPDESLAALGMSTRDVPRVTGALSAQLANLEAVDANFTVPFLDANPLAVDYLGDLLTHRDFFHLGTLAYKLRGVKGEEEKKKKKKNSSDHAH
jgi:hypothetical protein